MTDNRILSTLADSTIAGKNAVINGGMDIFQRGSYNTLNSYSLDRWYINASTTTTVTQSTAKTTPNSQYMMLMTATGTQQIYPQQVIETKNAIYYAGKTVTLSAYAAGLTTTTNLQMDLSYSTSTDNAVTGTWTSITAAGGNANLTLSSTVTRWSATYSVPSDAKSLKVLFVNNAANITVGQGIYLGDVQLEVGSVATTFSRAGGTIQGELAASQRYLPAIAAVAGELAAGMCYATTAAIVPINFPVTPRVAPTGITVSSAGAFRLRNSGAAKLTVTGLNFSTATLQSCTIEPIVASGLVVGNATNLFNETAGTILFTGCEL